MIVRSVWCSGFVLAIAPGRAGRIRKGKPRRSDGAFSFWGRATIGVGESDSDECHLQSKWTGHLGPATTHRDRLNSPNYFALNMRASARQGNSEHVEDDTLEQQA
jgi:hypothetical protein